MTFTWHWGNSTMKPNPNPCHHVYLGWLPADLLEVLAIGPNICFKIFLDHFCRNRQGWHKGDLMGVKTLQPLYHGPCNLSGCFAIGPCWSLDWYQAIIDISSEHNCRKNNNIKLFSTVLSWFDLVVTLSWPWHDLGVTPPWSLTPTHVTMYTWVEFRPIYCKCWPLVHIYIYFFNILGPFLLDERGVTQGWFDGGKNHQTLILPL